jgi:DNA topoisomerase-2
MFDADGKLHKYESVEEVIDYFFGIRISYYGKRKDYLLAELNEKWAKLSNKARYIQLNLDGTIDLRRKTAQQVSDLLSGLNFDHYGGDYKYLIKMPMDSVTEENVASIMKECQTVKAERDLLEATPLQKLWLDELDAFETAYNTYKVKREQIQAGSNSVEKKSVIRRTVKKAKITA